MIDPSLHPSRQLRLLASVARWSLRLVAAFWLTLIVVWLTLHFLIVPRIGDWRGEVERLASQALGAPTRIASISGQSNGLFPTIALHNVQVLDAQERVALHLDQVVATLSARSVLRLGLEQLYIDAPVLDIRHLADGRWQIAGLTVAGSKQTDGASLDWLLEQPELLIRNGQVTFTDEQRAVQAVQWHGVDFVMRNRHWSHVLRVDASMGAASAERVQLVGAFRQPILPSNKAPWSRWSGQWYASLALEQMPHVPWPQAWPMHRVQGHGLARAWVDVHEGKPFAVALDAALPSVEVQWKDERIQPLRMQQLQGRFEAVEQDHAWQVSAQDLRFQHEDAGPWPLSHWRMQSTQRQGAVHTSQLDLSFADLATVSKVAQALPLPAAIQDRLVQWQPMGQVQQLSVQWQADGNYRAKGQAKQLALRAQPAADGVGIPGFEGVDARFDLNAQGGSAKLSMQAGVLHFPGVFEDPAVALDHLDAQLQWRVENNDWSVQVVDAEFANADAQGRMQGVWQTGREGRPRLPGHLQLQGELERADGARVHRYLPLHIPQQARHYVRDSVQSGLGRQVAFEVNGDLHDMPFDAPGSGRFWIKAPLSGVTYAYVPAAWANQEQPAWPALQDLRGDLIFEGASMRVENASTSFAGHPQLRMQSVAVQIADLKHPRIAVQAQGESPLNAALDLTRQSPLAIFTSHALDGAKAQGRAHIGFALDVPIAHLEQTTVTGQVGFQNTALQLNPYTPQLRQLQGAVHFHEQGFLLSDVRGQGLGGAFQATGGMPSVQQGVQVHVDGTATAQGMQQDTALAALQQVAQFAQGNARYAVNVAAQQGGLAVSVHSDLKGLVLQLPAPLGKTAAESTDLSVAHTWSAQAVQELKIKASDRAQLWMRQSSTAVSDQMQAYLGLGQVDMPSVLGAGVAAEVKLPAMDVDAWLAVFSAATAPKASSALEPAPVSPWLPERLQLDVGQLRWQGRALEQLQARIQHTKNVWHGQVQAKQLAGDIEYRQAVSGASAGLVFARLTHLSIPKAHATEPAPLAQETTGLEALPALDIEVEHFEVAGRSLGKLQLQAKNTVGAWGRDWLLERFDLETTEARWKATGYWGRPAQGAPRSTKMSFLLDMDSSGQLLERFGMPGVIRDGQGRLSGNIAWQGSPMAPDWKSMDGGVHMQMHKGQFLKVEPGMGKLLSVLSLQSLTRRINLDFRDVFSQGFAFDFIRGDIGVARGIARTNNLQMKGLNAAVLLEGQASLVDETQRLQVVVVPEINAMTASLAATAINPVIGVGSFLAQMFLRGPLMEAATRTFHVHGTWSDPVVEAVRKDAKAGLFVPQEVNP